jgi:hypothetical protein
MAEKKFAMIVDSEVFAVFTFDVSNLESNPNIARIVAGMSSNPIAVDASSIDGIEWGWTFDGTNFIPPSE